VRQSSRGARVGRSIAPGRVAEQPFLEPLGIGVVVGCALEQCALDRQADGIRRLIALALLSAAFGCFQRGEQRAADIARASDVAHVPYTDAPPGATVTRSA
jgi:hypothetical protein